MEKLTRFHVPYPIYQDMLHQALAEQPNECCGLLAGRYDGFVCFVERRFPLINAAHSPRLYSADVKSLLRAEQAIRHLKLDVVGVYHSHPTSAPIPSKTDRERNYSTETPNFIISLVSEPPLVRGWWLTAEDYRETDWQLVDVVWAEPSASWRNPPIL